MFSLRVERYSSVMCERVSCGHPIDMGDFFLLGMLSSTTGPVRSKMASAVEIVFIKCGSLLRTATVDGKILSVIQNKRGRSHGGGPFVLIGCCDAAIEIIPYGFDYPKPLAFDCTFWA